MKKRTRMIDPQREGGELSGEDRVRLQEQFIKQVEDSSLPASQVLTERNKSLQKDDRAPDDSAHLFVP
jgi:hypothetical protein